MGIRALIICSTLCVLFGVLAWFGERRTSPTMDEPNHVAVGWAMLWRQDFRVSPDVPPLWEYWLGLTVGKDGLRTDPTSPAYLNMQIRRQMSAWADQTVFHTAGVDGLKVVARARRFAILAGMALAALIGWWAWKLGGLIPAVAATYLYCLDPNFLGHAGLTKNDVASALTYLATAYFLWRSGRQITWRNALGLAALTAIGVLVKFSGLLAGPVLVIALTARALSAEPWIVLGKPLNRRWTRMLAAVALCATAAVTTYIGMWAAYGFRFDAGPDGLTVQVPPLIDRFRTTQLQATLGRGPTPDELAQWQPPMITRVMLWGLDRRLLPQAWGAGFLHTQIEDQGLRPGYLLGEKYLGGKWYYFPLAAVFKSPISTLLAIVLALIAGAAALWRGLSKSFDCRWTLIAMIVPAGLYAVVMLTANINIGLRHAFPIYPFVFIAAGLGLSRVWNRTGGKILMIVLALGLAKETEGAHGHYIAYFNSAFSDREMTLLADSNLDWGQDIPLLADWQAKHPTDTLYFDCFGRTDPAAYGIRYVNLPNGYTFGPAATLPSGPGVVAISATVMQLDCPPGSKQWKQLGLSADSKPEKILGGGTIFLYRIGGGR